MTAITHDSPHLELLADAYQVLGELCARDDARTFLGRRRADGAPVLIALPRVPQPDERNALTLYAADANLLTGLDHQNLVPVLESRWLGGGVLAVVTEQPDSPTLEEMLERGETLASARVAAILREVNALLEWAREEKVVHRAVEPTTVFVDEGSERVRASFIVQPIPLSGAPAEEGDARTIASLAWAMLAGTAAPRESVGETLAERRRDLPERIIARTEALLAARPGSVAPEDVRNYIAEVAMAEPIRAAEIEAARIEAVRIEELRAGRDELAAARAEHERTVAEAEKRLAEERDRLERERAELDQRRAELDRAIAAARERFELERQELELQRAALEASAAERSDRDRTEHDDAVAVPLFEQGTAAAPVDWPAPSTKSRGQSAAGRAGSGDGREWPEPALPLASSSGDGDDDPSDREPGRAWWLFPAAGVALVVLIVASAFGIGGRARRATRATVTAAGEVAPMPTRRAATPPVVATVARAPSRTTLAAALTADSIARAAAADSADSVARADSMAAAERRAAARRRARARADSIARAAAEPSSRVPDDPFALPPLPPAARSLAPAVPESGAALRRPLPRRDSLGRRDSTATTRPDSASPRGRR